MHNTHNTSVFFSYIIYNKSIYTQYELYNIIKFTIYCGLPYNYIIKKQNI